MNLRFLLPEIPGLGVWQIDTGSKNSILNINSCAKIIRRAFGRISMIPLKLTLEPTEVNNPETGKKQTVHVLNLRTDITLSQLADVAREQSKQYMLEAPDLEAAFDAQVEQDIEDLWGPDESKPKAAAVTASDAANAATDAASDVPDAAANAAPEPDEKPKTKPKAAGTQAGKPVALVIPPKTYGDLKAIVHARVPNVPLNEIDVWLTRNVGMNVNAMQTDPGAAYLELKAVCGWED